MADSPVEELLLKFGFDLSGAKQGAGALKQILDELNKVLGSAAVQQAQMDKATLANVQSVSKIAVEAAKQGVLEEQKKAAAVRTSAEELKKQGLEHKVSTEQSKAATAAEIAKKAAIQASTAEIQKQIQQRKAETSEIQRQIAELRKKRLADQESGGHGGGEGGADRLSIWGIGGGIGKALLGPGIGGAIAAGVLAGGGLTLILESAAHAVEHFVEKLKEVTIESGKLAILQDQFEGLARAAGVDPVEAMDKLREKTEGLVSDFQLLKIANTGLKADVGLTTDKIAELSGAVLNLAEGRAVPAARAMQMLDMAIARGTPMMLARVTGVSSLKNIMDQIPPAMSRAEKQTRMWELALAELEKREKIVGTLPETIERTEERMHIATKNLMEGFGRGVNESPGMQAFLKFLNQGSKDLTGLISKAHEWGITFGNAIGTLTPGLDTLRVTLSEITDIVSTTIHSFLEMFDIIDSRGRGSTGFITAMVAAFTFLSTMVQEASFVIKSLIQNTESLVHNLLSVASAAIAVSTGQFAAAKQFITEAAQDVSDIPKAWKQNWEEFDKDNKAMLARAQTTLDELNKPPKAKQKHTKDDTESADSIRDRAKLAQLEEQLEIAKDKRLRALAKSQLADREADLAYLKEVENKWYQDGEQRLDAHIKALEELAQQEHQAKLAQIAEDFKAQSKDLESKQKLLDAQQKIGTIKPFEYKVKTEILGQDVLAAQDGLNSKLANEDKRYQREKTQIEQQGDRDRRAERLKAIQAEAQRDQETQQLRLARFQRQLSLEQDEIQKEQQLREKRFAGRDITPDSYFQQTLAADNRLRDAQIKNAQDVFQAKKAIAASTLREAFSAYEAGPKTTVAEETRQQKVQKAATDLAKAREILQDNVVKYTQQTEEKITLLMESETEKRLAYIQGVYQYQQQALESIISFQQSALPGQTFAQPTVDLLSKLTQNLQAQRLELERLANSSSVEKYSTDWYKIVDATEKTWQAQVKYNEELLKMTDHLRPAISLFGQLGQQIGEVFHSKFAQNLGQVIGSATQSLEKTQERIRIITGAGPKKDPALEKLELEATDLFAKTRSSGDQLGTQLNATAQAAQNATNQINVLAAALSILSGQPTTPAATTLPAAPAPVVIPLGIPGQPPSVIAAPAPTPAPISQTPGPLESMIRAFLSLPGPLLPPQSIPVTTPSSVQVSTPKSIPVNAPTSIPVESKSIPITGPTSIPITGPTSIPITGPTSISVNAPTSIPVESKPIPVESKPIPVTAPTSIPVESKPISVTAPTSIPVDSKPISVNAPTSIPVESKPISVNAPTSIPVESKSIPVNAPTSIPITGPTSISVNAPTSIPVESKPIPVESKPIPVTAPTSIPVESKPISVTGPTSIPISGPTSISVNAPTSIPVKSKPIPVNAPTSISVNAPTSIPVESKPIPVNAPASIPITGPTSIPITGPTSTSIPVESKPISVTGPTSIPVSTQKSISVAAGPAPTSVAIEPPDMALWQTAVKTAAAALTSFTETVKDSVNGLLRLLAPSSATLSPAAPKPTATVAPGSIFQAIEKPVPVAPPKPIPVIPVSAPTSIPAPDSIPLSTDGVPVAAKEVQPVSKSLDVSAVQTSLTKLDTAVSAFATSLGGVITAIQQKVQQLTSIKPPTIPIEPVSVSAVPISPTPTTPGKSKAAPDTTSAKFQTELQHMVDKVTAVTGALADFVSTITQAKSALAGGVGGGIAGAGLGGMVGSIGSQLGAFGSLGGPIGQIVGGVAGAAVGAITGAKNARVTANITHLQEQFKETMNQFSLNTNNLNNTIQQLQVLVQSAKQLQASSKKGSSQYQQVIDQYNSQIMQLNQQQHQLMVNLQEQLTVLQAPTGMQEYLDSLESILKQYNQFEGAAQSANDLAKANEFLVRSLQQYQLGLADQIRQDNTQAINDALQLNDLLYQRTQLIAQLNDQIRSTLTQGVLVRQPTFAQQKGTQIEQMQYQGQLQLQQLNEQISASQYRVNAESQIFSIATTRVGLEAQLLQLQAAQTDRDMQRIAALSAVVQALQSGNYNFGPLSQLLAALPGVSNSAVPGAVTLTPDQLAQLMNPTAAQAPAPPTPTPGPGATGMTSIADQLFAGAYQDRASMGYGSFRGANLL